MSHFITLPLFHTTSMLCDVPHAQLFRSSCQLSNCTPKTVAVVMRVLEFRGNQKHTRRVCLYMNDATWRRTHMQNDEESEASSALAPHAMAPHAMHEL
jgi:hypothetical protein